MSYNHAFNMTFRFTVTDLTVGRTFAIPLPTGKRARIRDIAFNANTGTGGATSKARIQAGRAGDLSRYADMEIPDTAAANAVMASRLANALRNRATGAAPMTDKEEQILITTIPPTGAGAAGAGDIHVSVDFF